jgi:hypothetical protein
MLTDNLVVLPTLQIPPPEGAEFSLTDNLEEMDAAERV